MKRYISLLAILTAIVVLLCGCSLAREDADASNVSHDALIGVYITAEPLDLFDFEGYVSANPSALAGGNISTSDAMRYSGRLYAELIDGQYVFPETDGFAFFCTATNDEHGTAYSSRTDEGICGAKLAMNTKDDEQSIELECTIYGIAGIGRRHSIYINPVYQAADGNVYLTSGHGIATSGDTEGGSFSQSLKESTTVTDSEGSTVIRSASISVSYTVTTLPIGYTLIEMDSESRELARSEYAPGMLPESYAANADTAYIIVETRTADGSAYALYSAENTDIVTYAELKEKGVLTEKHTYVTFASSEADNA